MRASAIIAVLMAAVLLAACGGQAVPTAQETVQPSPTATERSPAREPSKSPETPAGSADRDSGSVLKTASSEFGRMLFARNGQAIYLFDKETTGRPDCYGACAQAWPPVLTRGAPQATQGVRPGLLGTTRRKDGSRQVTYAGHPLYFYAHEDPNQVLCHNITEFGGLWLVVTPGGEPAA
ncbi:MAG: COG4315 family predicted lipoprotein [Nocardioidaceae bacterium]